MRKFAYLIMAIAVPTAQANAELPDCVSQAAAEFGAAPKVFEALAINSTIHPLETDIHHGPMGLFEQIIPMAAEGIGVTPEKIREDECENYRAAAWLLMNPAGGHEDGIWEAMKVYFYGKSSRTEFPLVERVRDIHEKLIERESKSGQGEGYSERVKATGT